MNVRTSLVLIGAGLLCAPGCGPAEPDGPVTALIGGRLIDGTGAQPVGDAVVLIWGERIFAAGAAGDVSIPEGAITIDLAGKTVMPGIIESNGHVIFSGQSNHPTYWATRWPDYYEIGARSLNASLMQGITTVRDTMDPLEEMLRLRSDVATGKIAGSRLYTCGTILNYPGSFRSDTPEIRALDPTAVSLARAAKELDVRDMEHGQEIVTDYAQRGVDFIKVSAYSGPDNDPPVLSTGALRGIVERAHDRGLSVSTHTMSIESVRSVVEAGVDAMEHPEIMATEHIGEGELPDDLIQRIVADGIYSIPLVVAIEVYVTYLRDPSLLEDPDHIRHAPADQVLEGRDWVAQQLADNPNAADERDRQLDLAKRNLGKLIAAGAPIAMGTDKGTRLNYHESANHVRELEIYRELGMTPMDAIVSATRRGAELLGVEDELGTIEAGKLADVIVVDGDPLADIRALDDVAMVFMGGARFK